MKYLFIMLFLSTLLLANEQECISQSQSVSQKNHLWESNEWLDLLYYEKDSQGNYESAVVSEQFFLKSSTKPKEELIESIKTICHQNISNTSFQCTYPLRYKYLTDVFSLKADYSICTSLNKYMQEDVKHVKLVMPVSSLKNPASIFGHSFLVLEGKNKILSTSLNFSAKNTSTNSFEYMYRGMSGSFKSSFVHQPYFQILKDYQNLESRNMWEFEITLSASEKKSLQLYFYELKNIYFKYYFFNKNCAYYSINPLEIILHKKLLDKDNLYLIPHDVILSLKKHQLIKNVTLLPSKTNLFMACYKRLNQEEQSSLKELLSNESINQNSINAKTAICFNEISEFVLTWHKKAKIVRKNRLKLIDKLASFQNINTNKQKYKYYKYQKIAISYSSKNNFSLEFRPLLLNDMESYDFLESVNVIELLNIKLNFNSKYNIKSARINLINLKYLHDYNAYLNNYSWYFKTNVHIENSQKLYNFEGGFGYAKKIVNHLLVYSLFGIDVGTFSKKLIQARYKTQVEIGFYTKYKKFTINSMYLMYNIKNLQDYYNIFKVQFRYNLDTSNSINIKYTNQAYDDKLNLQYNYYF